MFDVKIERLRLNVDNAAGHEHRLEPITLRAVTLLAERLDASPGMRANGLSRNQWDTVNAERVDLQLNTMSDEQAAEGIATAWTNALTARPQGQD